MAANVPLEPGFLLLALAGVALAVVLAVIAGRLTARLFFDASRRPSEDPIGPKRGPAP